LRTIDRHHHCNRLLTEDAKVRPVKREEVIENSRPVVGGEGHSKSRVGETREGGGGGGMDTKEAERRLEMRTIGNIVPPEVYNAYPSINKQAYNKLKGDAKFMSSVVPVCEECYLWLTSLNEASGSLRYDHFALLRDEVRLRGTGRLRPDTLKLRHVDTMLRIEEDELGKFNRQRLLMKVDEGNRRAEQVAEERGLQQSKGSSRAWSLHNNGADLAAYRKSDPSVNSRVDAERGRQKVEEAVNTISRQLLEAHLKEEKKETRRQKSRSMNKTGGLEERTVFRSTQYSSSILQGATARSVGGLRSTERKGEEGSTAEGTREGWRQGTGTGSRGLLSPLPSLSKLISKTQMVGFREGEGSMFRLTARRGGQTEESRGTGGGGGGMLREEGETGVRTEKGGLGMDRERFTMYCQTSREVRRVKGAKRLKEGSEWTGRQVSYGEHMKTAETLHEDSERRQGAEPHEEEMARPGGDRSRQDDRHR
jgi:hypothetical protein